MNLMVNIRAIAVVVVEMLRSAETGMGSVSLVVRASADHYDEL
jgi:hypothetical protein